MPGFKRLNAVAADLDGAKIRESGSARLSQTASGSATMAAAVMEPD